MRFIKASQIFDGKRFLDTDCVVVLDECNKLLNIVKQVEIDENKTETYEGIICPGFINSHCHLELSHMKGLIEEKTGLVNFAKGIIAGRHSFSSEVQMQEMIKANALMFNSGIVAVGDICNGPESFEIKAASNLFYHSFIELIGLNPAIAQAVFNKGKEIANEAKGRNLSFSLAPHAPYSVSMELMQLVSNFNTKNTSLSTIHNQESKEENKFFMSEASDFYELYKFLNIDISYFRSGHRSSLQTCLPSLMENRTLILVHNTFSSTEDIDFAEKQHKGLYWCLCPNANLFIENTLPDVELLINKKVRICVGTDSLASNHTLSIVDELNTLLKNIPFLQVETVLRWATWNGAEALGIEAGFGALIKGKNAGLNLLQSEGRQLHFSQKLA